MPLRSLMSPLFSRRFLLAGLGAFLLAVAALLGIVGLASAAKERVPWTSSNFRGTPEPPPPYTLKRIFPKLEWKQGLEMDLIPGTDRIVVAQRGGRVFAFTAEEAEEGRQSEILDLATAVPELNSIYGIAFDPDPERSDVYLCYSVAKEADDGTRVSRFRYETSPEPRIVPESEQLLLTFGSGSHNGGCLRFGPDGCLYISTGDARPPTSADSLNTGQRIDDFLASILRIEVRDRETYAVPEDNPFVDHPEAAPEVWAYGLRNPWKMAFEPGSGALWVGDVGWETWEMIHRLESGANAGWSAKEGPLTIKPGIDTGPRPIQPPIAAYDHSEGLSVTGGDFYTSDRLPELTGLYLYGDYITGKVWGIRSEDGEVLEHRELADTNVMIVSFGKLPDGEIVALSWGNEAKLYRLVPNPEEDASDTFPTRLSESGLFEDLESLSPAPGVYPFSVIEPLWSGEAVVQRHVAIPGNKQIRLSERDHHTGRRVNLHQPGGSVFARTLSLPPHQSPDGKAKPVETQVLHHTGEAWNGYSYRWNEDGTDAELVPREGADEEIPTRDGVLPWRYHSRAECSRCHGKWSGVTLAFVPWQLDGANRERFLDLGLIDRKFAEEADRLSLASSRDEEAPLDLRARSWLHANCAHCHQYQAGGSVAIRLHAKHDTSDIAALGEEPIQHHFGIPEARVVAPGEPFRSVLYYRVATEGSGRMPQLGHWGTDPEGLRVLREWIASLELPGGEARAVDPSTSEAPVIEALNLQAKLDAGEVEVSEAKEQIQHYLASGPPETTGLFLRFLDPDDRPDLVGARPDRAAILGRVGDPEAGAALFESKAAACLACHRVDDRGIAWGPDLTALSATATRESLLESLIDPSAAIAAPYRLETVATEEGDTFSGFVRDEEADTIQVHPAGGLEPVSIPGESILSRTPSPVSAMPTGLVATFTHEELADLIAFLLQRNTDTESSPSIQP